MSDPRPSDYEPVDWDGRKFSAFGIFYGERFGYARNYGIVDDQWHRFAARYNIWEKSHAYQEADGTDPVTPTQQALKQLRSRYRTVRARQLFHNRNEVMVFLQV